MPKGGLNNKKTLTQAVGHVRHQGQMTGPFDGLGHLALVFEGGTGQTTWQQFALLVDELKQKVRILLVNVTDTILAESAVFLAGFLFDGNGREAVCNHGLTSSLAVLGRRRDSL